MRAAQGNVRRLAAVSVLAVAGVALAFGLFSNADDPVLDRDPLERVRLPEVPEATESAGLQARPAPPLPEPPGEVEGQAAQPRDEPTDAAPEDMGTVFRHFRAKAWAEGLAVLRRVVENTKPGYRQDELRLWLLVALLERGPAGEAIEGWLSFVEDANRLVGAPDPEYHFNRRSFFLNKFRISDAATGTWSLHITLGHRFNSLGRQTSAMNAYFTSRVKSQLVDVLARDRPGSPEEAQAVAFHRFLEVNLAIGVVSNEPDLQAICPQARAFVEEHRDSDHPGIRAMVSYLERMLPECWRSR